MAGMIIPSKTLNDKYKLSDFQNDFNKLFDLYSKPVKIKFGNFNNTIEVTNESGRTEIYSIVRQAGQISKVINTTENITTKIEWGGN